MEKLYNECINCKMKRMHFFRRDGLNWDLKESEVQVTLSEEF